MRKLEADQLAIVMGVVEESNNDNATHVRCTKLNVNEFLLALMVNETFSMPLV